MRRVLLKCIALVKHTARSDVCLAGPAVRSLGLFFGGLYEFDLDPRKSRETVRDGSV